MTIARRQRRLCVDGANNCRRPLTTFLLRIATITDTYRKFPISLWLEIEARCNLACRFCYNFWRDGRENYPVTLPTDTLLQGLNRLLENFACRSVAISGGEPLL